VENPYWQYFCGGKFFEHRFPIDPSSMSRWRGRLKEAGVEQMLAELIATGLRSGAIRPSMLERVNVDTTVQEKFIRFPTEARLYDRMRARLVTAAQQRGIGLRQSYTRGGTRDVDESTALRECATVSAGATDDQTPAHAAGPRSTRHPAQDDGA
jgi:IS5 family transposase